MTTQSSFHQLPERVSAPSALVQGEATKRFTYHRVQPAQKIGLAAYQVRA